MLFNGEALWNDLGREEFENASSGQHRGRFYNNSHAATIGIEWQDGGMVGDEPAGYIVGAGVTHANSNADCYLGVEGKYCEWARTRVTPSQESDKYEHLTFTLRGAAAFYNTYQKYITGHNCTVEIRNTRGSVVGTLEFD